MDARTALQGTDLATAKRAAELVQMRHELGSSGRSSIAWGVLNIALAALNMPEAGLGRWIIGMVMVLGVLLVAEGVWVMRRPTPAAMRAEAESLFILALWNLMIAGLLLLAGQAPVAAVLWGVVQWIGSHRMRQRVRRYTELCGDAALAPVADAVEHEAAVLPGAAVGGTDVVSFDTASLAGRFHWLARLGPDYALVADKDGKGVLVAARSELDITDRGEKLIGTLHKAKVTLGGRKLSGTVDPQSLQRLAAWKAGTPRPALTPVAAAA